jgi:magnesium transporter
MADDESREPRLEERLGAAIGRTAGLVVRVPIGLLGQGATLLGQLTPRGHGPPGARPGLDLQGQVEATAEPPRITLIEYGADACHKRNVENLERYLETPDAPREHVRWLNVEGLDVGTVQRIARAYALHPLAAEDVLHAPQRPKFEQFDETSFIVSRMLRIEDGHLIDEQVSFFVVGSVVITFQQERGDVWDRVRARLDTRGSTLRQREAGYLVYALLDAIVDHCFPVLEHYGDLLADLEDELLDEDGTEGLEMRIHSVKRDLLILRRVLWPMRDLVAALREAPPGWVSSETKAYLRDVHDHAVRVIDLLETFRELAGGLHDLYLSRQSQKMNEVMKVLTVMATIFIPISFLAGVWGMNFRGMPELEWRYGYPMAIGTFAATTGLLLVYFKRKGWL